MIHSHLTLRWRVEVCGCHFFVCASINTYPQSLYHESLKTMLEQVSQYSSFLKDATKGKFVVK